MPRKKGHSAVGPRFYAKIMADPDSGCWLWTGHINHYGYGQIGDGYIVKIAHRVSWELHKGPIPPGIFVCHKCDVRACVNPDHLFLGTPAENTADMMTKGRHRPTGLRGEDSPGAKLTDEQVIAIKASNETQKSLAAQFGVGQTLISQIKTGHIWRHIDDNYTQKFMEKNRAGFKSLSVVEYANMLSLLEMDER